MRAIRRSIKGEKDTRPLHASIPQKSPTAIIPPKKVIKAKYDYIPHPDNPHELRFAKGDFFHVISREDDKDWYEACNPLMADKQRGLVPVTYFDVVGKQDRQSAGSVQSGASNVIPPSLDHSFSERPIISQPQQQTQHDAGPLAKTSSHGRAPSMGKGSGAMVYGVVIYDFKAERPDELEAEQGESIIIIAQSNPEWFVAKPIKRLGGPGLIPVSFIEIRDMNTGLAVADTHAAVQNAGVPKVEEWKRLAANYKNSSIPLGKFSEAGPGSVQKDMGRLSLANQQSNGTNGVSNPSPSSAPNRAAVGSLPRQGSSHQRDTSRGQNNYDRQSSRQLLAPASASIPRYIFENDKYWYIIECQMEDGRWWELSRSYQKFYDFQIALLQQFPKEAQTPIGGKRLLPFMPGPVTYVTDAISNGRRESLNTYVKELLALPPYISRCDLVRELFAPREGDYELDPDRVTENFRHSGGSQMSMNGEMSRTASRQSSRGRMNGGPPNGYGNMGPPPQKVSQQPNGMGGGHYRHPSDMGYQQQPPPPPQVVIPKASTLTQGSSNSSHINASTTSLTNTNGINSNNPSGTMKLKFSFQNEIILIRMPQDISFPQLREKCKERLKIPMQRKILLSYHDEPTGQTCEVLSDRDLDIALSRCGRLVILVRLVED